jgi:hypothetical protein
MKIKIYFATIGLAACCFWPVSGHADDAEKYMPLVQATNGLSLGVCILDPKSGINTNTTELSVGMLFKAPTNTRSMFFMPKKEYLARVELYDSSNNPVAKTKLGSNYGVNFNDIYWDINKFAESPHGPCTARDSWDSWSWGGFLPKTSDLFVLTKPGTYRLKLEVQIMLYALDTAKKQTCQILRFPPVEITVAKPESPATRNN